MSSYLCFTGLLCALCQLGEVGGGGPVVLEVAAHQVTGRQGGHQAQLPSQHRGAHQSEDDNSEEYCREDYEESTAYLARVEAFWPGLVGCGPFTPNISRQEDWAGRMVPPPTVPT